MLSRTTLEQQGHFDRWGDYSPAAQDVNTSTSDPITTCWLNQFNVLKITGPDAERFLQGQLTCDLSALTTDNHLLGACCTAKGRVVANFNISFDGDSYWLVLPVDSAEVLEKHLQKYKVFFKATLSNCLESHMVFGQWHKGVAGHAKHTEHTESGHIISISDTRQIVIIPTEAPTNLNTLTSITLTDTLHWRLADIHEGLYFVDHAQTEKWVPQHINWHHLKGVSFNKGCYTGQEIIARLQYLGKAKKALYHYRGQYDGNTLETPLPYTTLFNQEGKSLGDLLTHRSRTLNGQQDLSLLVVLNGEFPDKTLYLTDSMDFPLTLQNLPYTVEKEA